MTEPMDDEKLVLEWKKEGDRWILGGAEGWYEVGKTGHGDDWECAWMFRGDGKAGVAAMIETATFEQAKKIAEQHCETGIWPGAAAKKC